MKPTILMLTAKEAIQISVSHQAEKKRLDEIAQRIQDEALMGHYSVQIHQLSEFARTYLLQRGYRITPHDHPDGGGYYTVHWGDIEQYR